MKSTRGCALLPQLRDFPKSHAHTLRESIPLGKKKTARKWTRQQNLLLDVQSLMSWSVLRFSLCQTLKNIYTSWSFQNQYRLDTITTLSSVEVLGIPSNEIHLAQAVFCPDNCLEKNWTKKLFFDMFSQLLLTGLFRPLRQNINILQCNLR